MYHCNYFGNFPNVYFFPSHSTIFWKIKRRRTIQNWFSQDQHTQKGTFFFLKYFVFMLVRVCVCCRCVVVASRRNICGGCWWITEHRKQHMRSYDASRKCSCLNTHAHARNQQQQCGMFYYTKKHSLYRKRNAFEHVILRVCLFAWWWRRSLLVTYFFCELRAPRGNKNSYENVRLHCLFIFWSHSNVSGATWLIN